MFIIRYKRKYGHQWHHFTKFYSDLQEAMKDCVGWSKNMYVAEVCRVSLETIHREGEDESEELQGQELVGTDTDIGGSSGVTLPSPVSREVLTVGPEPSAVRIEPTE